MRTSPSKAKSPWWTATIAGMASYLDAAAIVTTGTALVLFQDHFNLGPAAIGQLSALLTIMIAIGALIGGRLGDTYGRKRVFAWTMVMFAAGALFLMLASGITMLYIGILLIGFAAGADLPVSMAMISESAPEGKKGKMITFSHVLWMVGVLVVQVFGIFVGDMGAQGARIMYAHLFIVAVVVLILRAGLPESAEWVRNKATETAGDSKRVITNLLRSRYSVPLLATALFYSVANIAANTNGQFSTYLYVNVAGASVATASTIGLVAFGFSFVGLLVNMKFVDSKWRMPVFVITSAISVVAFIIPVSLGVSTWSLAIMAILYSIGGSVAGEPMYKVWSQELFPTRYRSTAQGITIAFTRVVAAIFALFTPGIINGGVHVLFIFLISTTVVACLIGIFWLARIPKAADDEDLLATAKPVSIA